MHRHSGCAMRAAPEGWKRRAASTDAFDSRTLEESCCFSQLRGRRRTRRSDFTACSANRVDGVAAHGEAAQGSHVREPAQARHVSTSGARTKKWRGIHLPQSGFLLTEIICGERRRHRTAIYASGLPGLRGCWSSAAYPLGHEELREHSVGEIEEQVHAARGLRDGRHLAPRLGHHLGRISARNAHAIEGLNLDPAFCTPYSRLLNTSGGAYKLLGCNSIPLTIR